MKVSKYDNMFAMKSHTLKTIHEVEMAPDCVNLHLEYHVTAIDMFLE